jgi:ectoine hydroxylase-related dioxygenase (phytanoyl-CoA dioxygenase family)
MYKFFNEEEIKKLIHDWNYLGYGIVDILTDSECDNIVNELENLRIIRNLREDVKFSDYEPYMHPHKESLYIEKIFSHPKAVEVMEILLGGEVEGVQTWAYFKPPGELGRDAHQDGFYSQSAWNTIANISIALDETDETNGGIWALECSHFLPLLDIEVDEERIKTNPSNWRNERGKPCKMPDGHKFPKKYVTLKRGQALLIHSHLVHGSDDNTSNDKFRRSILSGYKIKGSYLRQGEHMKRVPIDVYELMNKHWVNSHSTIQGIQQ